jgi:hypothetical protein
MSVDEKQEACDNEQFLVSNLRSGYEIDIRCDKMQMPTGNMAQDDD